MTYQFVHELSDDAVATEVQMQPLLLAQVLKLLATQAEQWSELLKLDAVLVTKLYMDFCVRELQTADFESCLTHPECPALEESLQGMEEELQRQHAGGSWWDAY